MILSDTVTRAGSSAQFPLYEPGTATVRYDVHVRVEPESDTTSMFGIYDRRERCWVRADYVTEWPTRNRCAAEVWKRYGKFVPSEVLS